MAAEEVCGTVRREVGNPCMIGHEEEFEVVTGNEAVEVGRQKLGRGEEGHLTSFTLKVLTNFLGVGVIVGIEVLF